jgi:hypothetical protein
MRSQQINRKEDRGWFNFDYGDDITVLPEWNDPNELPPAFEQYLHDKSENSEAIKDAEEE